MKTAAQEWMEEAEAIGLQKGEAIGIKKGMLQAQQQMLVKIIQLRFDPSEKTIERLAQQLDQIQDVEIMYQLVDYSLEVLHLSEFLLHVERFLPTPEQPDQHAQSNDHKG
ncbi:MAG: hypothetical protein U0350_51965 [Caldilineaceae bacterium]